MTLLAVQLHSTRVGTLEYFEPDEEYEFTFDADWLADPERPVLGQFFEDRRPKGFRSSGPPCWFSHLMPQGPLRRAIAKALACDESDEYALYEFLGRDLPGAVVLDPIGDAPVRRPARHGVREVSEHFPWRSALPGAQLKMSVRRRERGISLPVAGRAGDVIAKFHSPDFKDLPRVEYATMSWAKAAGVTAPNIQLADASTIEDLPDDVPVGDGTVYLIDRFDRAEGGTSRVHFEDFAQVEDRPLNLIYESAQLPTRYETIAAVIARLCPEDLKPFVERVAFCIVAGNGDAHLKNWALLYPDRRHARLSPAYDLVSTVVYPRHLVADELALSLGGSRRFEDMSVASFDHIARVSDVSVESVRSWAAEMAARACGLWSEQKRDLGYSDNEIDCIAAHLSRVPLAAASLAEG